MVQGWTWKQFKTSESGLLYCTDFNGTELLECYEVITIFWGNPQRAAALKDTVTAEELSSNSILSCSAAYFPGITVEKSVSGSEQSKYIKLRQMTTKISAAQGTWEGNTDMILFRPLRFAKFRGLPSRYSPEKGHNNACRLKAE
jgi:hypothetical protein